MKIYRSKNKRLNLHTDKNYVCFGIRVCGWEYYFSIEWNCAYPQGEKPWVEEVHPKCKDIKGWRFGWKTTTACWGRDRYFY